MVECSSFLCFTQTSFTLLISRDLFQRKDELSFIEEVQISTLESVKFETRDLKRTRLVDALVSLVNMRPRDNPNRWAPVHHVRANPLVVPNNKHGGQELVKAKRALLRTFASFSFL